ncbi:hypothetical protein GCM10011316_05980 [Roseibium aquae]|uniref:Cell division protein FtsL n=1 Tax=Roseibium aquae TaxID=1323746 RepID=A0A916T995_9HYPH|nr:hypothetical protein [Roseibium aquae]GGB36629.1 hypothetical protein GCM10011316_05980 [Roseibium aquae]
MGRILNIVFVVAVVIGAATVYDMKLAAEKSAERVAELNRKIEEERQTIQHLRAEWSMLTQPERLQRLVERHNAYLELKPLEAAQIVRAEDLPARPVMLEPIGGPDPLGGYAGAATVVR